MIQTAFYATPDFWVMVAFLIVVGSIFKRVLKNIEMLLDMRAEKIKAKLDEARRLREEATQFLAEYQRRQRDATKEAEDIIVHAKVEAERQRQEVLAELEEVSRRRKIRALSRIVQAETQAIAEVRNLAIHIAVAATRRLIIENLNQEQARALIDQAIKELPYNL